MGEDGAEGARPADRASVGDGSAIDAGPAAFRHAAAAALPHRNSYRIPGTRIFAGEYPGHPDRDAARRTLERYLEAGITCFIDLTTEEDPLEPYEPILRAAAESRGVPAQYHRMRIHDMRTPSAREMTAILDTIDVAHRAGHGIYVHCWGGIGRTGTVIGCHLARSGRSGDAALDALAELWQTVEKSRFHPRSPQTDAQCAFVREWLETGHAPSTTARARAPRYLHEQLRGALFGLAVGDALGTAVEFKAPGTFAPVTDMTGGGPFGLKPGQWTDDTSMALCLAESLLECRGIDAGNQMRRYVRWWKEGHLSSTGRCFDIGTQTREALARFVASGDPLAGATEPRRSGNGSIMRLAPVPMYFVHSPREGLDACADSSRTTHGSAICLDGCRYFGGLLLGAFSGHTKAELLTPRFGAVPGYWDEHPLCPEVAEVADGSFRRRDPPEIVGNGYVVRSLEAALWAFDRSTSFAEGALLAVNLGDDADTTAAVYGQLAGAYYGEPGIPEEWRAKLARWPTINRLAEGLAARSP